MNTTPETGVTFTDLPSTGGPGGGSVSVVNDWFGPYVVPAGLVATN